MQKASVGKTKGGFVREPSGLFTTYNSEISQTNSFSAPSLPYSTMFSLFEKRTNLFLMRSSAIIVVDLDARQQGPSGELKHGCSSIPPIYIYYHSERDFFWISFIFLED